MPSETNEIVVEPNMLTKNNLKIGDTINLGDEIFKDKEVKIVGTIDSSLYFNDVTLDQTRGNTSIGAGRINYYAYVLPDNFDQKYYSSIYITVANSKEKLTSSEEYDILINDITTKLENIKSEQEDLRYTNLYNEINEEITEKEQEANEKLEEGKQELDNAKNELDEGKDKLNVAEKGLSSFKNQLDEAKNKLDIANEQLVLFKAELDKASVKLNSGKAEFNKALEQYNVNINEIETNINSLKKTINDIENLLKNLDSSTDEYKMYYQKLKELKVQLSQLETLNTTKKSIETSEAEYNSNVLKYNKSNQEYQSNLKKYESNLEKYNDSNRTYQESLEKYNTNLSKYEDATTEYNKEKDKAQEQINDAKEELNNIKHPIWYIYNRTNYSTYSEYIDDTNSIANLSKIFPVVFFAVAILVSLISMNRMVEEDRLEIGTLKSLGFSNNKIMSKYFIFSFSATVVGNILGSILGLIIIPLLIFNIYGMLFDVPNFQFKLNLNATILGFIIVIICVCGTSILSVLKVLKEKPSDLMRPKAPKGGKRVFIEKIKFIWNNLKFSNKVTIRNLFRYKKRVLVTVVGIAGCTALILCGFGIRDAIVDIANMQYDETFKFDATIYTNSLKDDDIKELFNDKRISKVTKSQTVSAEIKDIDVNMFITENNDELNSIVNLIDKNTQNKVQMEPGKIIITDKLADLAGLNVGDTIDILDVDNNFYQYEISAVVKNYLGHFIYIDKETFEKSGKTFEPNIVYINTTNELTEVEKEEISTKLLEHDEIINVSFTSALMESADNMLKSLNKVVAILIVLGAMLSFVVLYNLSSININERKREIATLKVLGFYDKEVDNYITKENILLTILGIAIGLIAGYFLTKGVITTVEIEKARFIHQIKFNSYLYASIISGLFTLIVNIITHFNLKKIDMIESLKSVE